MRVSDREQEDYMVVLKFMIKYGFTAAAEIMSPYDVSRDNLRKVWEDYDRQQAKSGQH